MQQYENDITAAAGASASRSEAIVERARAGSLERC